MTECKSKLDLISSDVVVVKELFAGVTKRRSQRRWKPQMINRVRRRAVGEISPLDLTTLGFDDRDKNWIAEVSNMKF